MKIPPTPRALKNFKMNRPRFVAAVAFAVIFTISLSSILWWADVTAENCLRVAAVAWGVFMLIQGWAMGGFVAFEDQYHKFIDAYRTQPKPKPPNDAASR
jgi:hypothetical protein